VSQLSNRLVARCQDIIEGLAAQLKADTSDAQKISEEMSTLRSAFTRYRDLSAQMDGKTERIKAVLGVLADSKEKEIGDTFELLDSLGIPSEVPSDIRSKTPFWKLLREIVRQVTEMQIVELEHTLPHFGISISRQAIESALKTHKDVFRVRKQGREKFVSVK
jgi:hypothetical protein